MAEFALQRSQALPSHRRLQIRTEPDLLHEAQNLAGVVIDPKVLRARGRVLPEAALQGRKHALLEGSEPVLHVVGELHALLEGHPLLLDGEDLDDLPAVPREPHAVDGGEELLHVQLDHRGVLRLREDLEQVLVAQEVETGEFAALHLEVVVQRLLAALLLLVDGVQSTLEPFDVEEGLQLGGVGDQPHDVPEGSIEPVEAIELVGECASREDGFEVNPASLA